MNILFSQLTQIVNAIATFIEIDEYYDFIEKRNKEEQIFLTVSGSFEKIFVPTIHDFLQLDSIYIFCSTPSVHRSWAENYAKNQSYCWLD